VAEVLVQFSDLVVASDTEAYVARACGGEMADGMWQGWIEFLPVAAGSPLRTGRETTQPNRTDLLYWATGLTAVYLEGALERALKPIVKAAEPVIPPPVFDGPLDEPLPAPPAVDSILNPFSVYRKGEMLLRNQLAALSNWHLVNIIRDYELSDLSPEALDRLPAAALIEIIVSTVREQEATSAR
jgi:hypothetical protein